MALLADRRDVPRRAPRIAELRAERTHVAVDDVARRRAGRPPHRFADRLARDRAARVRGEDEEDGLFGAREGRLLITAADAALHDIDLEVAHLDAGHVLHAVAVRP